KQLDQVISQSQVTNKAQVTQRELESTANSYHGLYETFLQRYLAAIQQDSLLFSDARVVALASPPKSRTQPKPDLVLALSLICGIGLGVGAGLLWDAMDRVFRTGGQLQSLLQIPCLALVPLLKDMRPAESKLKIPGKTLDRRMIVRDTSVFWRVVDAP